MSNEKVVFDIVPTECDSGYILDVSVEYIATTLDLESDDDETTCD